MLEVVSVTGQQPRAVKQSPHVVRDAHLSGVRSDIYDALVVRPTGAKESVERHRARQVGNLAEQPRLLD